MGEECDPGPPSSGDRFCCTPACKVNPFQIGKDCGSERPLGLCEAHDACDAQGRCGGRVKSPGESCRDPFTNSACDLGDVCDGVSPDCPVTGDIQCAVVGSQESGKKTINVLCRAPRFETGRAKCTAVGFQASGTPGVVEADARAAVDTGCSPGGRRVSAKVTKPLTESGAADLVQRTLTLPLNDLARKLLRKQGSLKACVRVQISVGHNVLETVHKSVTVRR